MRRVMADVRAHVKIWWRSPSAVFFTVAFPLLLVFIFGSIFGGDDVTLNVAVQDNDDTTQSRQLLAALEGTGALELHPIGTGLDAAQVAADEDHHTTLVVPDGYGRSVASGQPTSVTLITDASRTQSATAAGIIRSVVGQVNFEATGGRTLIGVQQQESDASGGADSYIEFFLPGVIGLTIATNSLIGGLEHSAMLHENGILRKVATTPIRKWEWVAAKAIYQVFQGAITATIIIVAALLLFDVTIRLDWRWVVILALGAASFSGMAMAMSRWVKKPDQANAAGSAVAFPMMFLSGTFFPLETMPTFLRAFAQVLPLTYVNEGMRAAMITGNENLILTNGLVVAVIAIVSVALAAWLLEWKEV